MPARSPDRHWPDPHAAAARQIASDRDRTSWNPALFDRKRNRMIVSPFAFLRGTAGLYYELLRDVPDLADGPDGEGWIVGDLHLENFGAFRVEPLGDAPEVIFDLNDFDDTAIAPWRWDVLRLATSLILAAREGGRDGSVSIALARKLVHAYSDALASGRTPHQPPMVEKLVKRVGERKRVQFLDSRTELVGGKRRFINDDRYQRLPASEIPAVRKALANFVRGDGGEMPPHKFMEIVDIAFRVAGTGSLGCRRVAVLIEGKGSPDGCSIFDLKEEGDPSMSVLGIKSDLAPNERVVAGARACLARLPFALGTTTLHNRPMIGRRLNPQEDKLDASSMEPDEFEAVAGYFGAVAARAHHRGAKSTPKSWTAHECDKVVARAVAVAGWHQAAYLAYCSLV